MTEFIALLNPWGIWNMLAVGLAVAVIRRTWGEISLTRTVMLALAALANAVVTTALIFVELI